MLAVGTGVYNMWHARASKLIMRPFSARKESISLFTMNRTKTERRWQFLYWNIKDIDYKVKGLECVADSYPTYQDIPSKFRSFVKVLTKQHDWNLTSNILTFFAYSYPISERCTTNSIAQRFSRGPIKILYVKIRIFVTADPKPNQSITPYVTLFPFVPYEHITVKSMTASTMTASAVLIYSCLAYWDVTEANL